MKLSHLKNIIRKTLKEANLITEKDGDPCDHYCYCEGGAGPIVAGTEIGGYCESNGGCPCGGGSERPKNKISIGIDTGGFTPDTPDTPDFAKNTPRAFNVRPTTLTEDENTTMKLSRLKHIIREELRQLNKQKSLNEASRAQRPDWFPPQPDIPPGEYGHMPESLLNEKDECAKSVTMLCMTDGRQSHTCTAWLCGTDPCAYCDCCGIDRNQKGPAEPMGRVVFPPRG